MFLFLILILELYSSRYIRKSVQPSANANWKSVQHWGRGGTLVAPNLMRSSLCWAAAGSWLLEQANLERTIGRW
jgi:hypothetical protein